MVALENFRPNRVTDDFSIDFIDAARTDRRTRRAMVMFLPLLRGGIAYLACKKVGEIKRKEGEKLRHAASAIRGPIGSSGERPFSDTIARPTITNCSNLGLFSQLTRALKIEDLDEASCLYTLLDL